MDELVYMFIGYDHTKPNNFISDDIDVLRKHYTIMLDYVNHLEKKIKKQEQILENQSVTLKYQNEELKFYELCFKK